MPFIMMRGVMDGELPGGGEGVGDVGHIDKGHLPGLVTKGYAKVGSLATRFNIRGCPELESAVGGPIGVRGGDGFSEVVSRGVDGPESAEGLVRVLAAESPESTARGARVLALVEVATKAIAADLARLRSPKVVGADTVGAVEGVDGQTVGVGRVVGHAIGGAAASHGQGVIAP